MLFIKAESYRVNLTKTCQEHVWVTFHLQFHIKKEEFVQFFFWFHHFNPARSEEET